jgi:hypothetical protein
VAAIAKCLQAAPIIVVINLLYLPLNRSSNQNEVGDVKIPPFGGIFFRYGAE